MIYEMDDETYHYNLNNLNINLLDHFKNNQINFITAKAIWPVTADKVYIEENKSDPLLLIRIENNIGYYSESNHILEYFRYFFFSNLYHKELFISWATTKHMSIEISERIFSAIIMNFIEYVHDKQSQGIIKSIPLNI